MTASNKVWDGSGLVSWPSFATLLADMLAMAATSQEDAEIFFASVEKLLEERIQAVEAEAGAEEEQAEGDVVVRTKVINVSRTSQQNNQQIPPMT